MEKNLLRFLQFSFVLLLSVSCTQNKKVQDEWIGKEIVFPEALLQLKNGRCSSLATFNQKLKGRKKIIAVIDANCRKCIIGQLNRIDSLFVPLLASKKAEIVFVLNINRADSLYFMTNMYPEIKAKGVLLWDNGYHFETENAIFTEKVTRRTFLLDENNKIIQVGNPLFEPKLLTVYKKLLEE